MKTIYYIDTENVGAKHWDDLIKRMNPGDTVAVFYSNTVDAISIDIVKNLSEKRVNHKDIKICPGKKGANAMDFHIMSYLGFAIARMGRTVGYRIVSNDGGYDPAVKYWHELGYDVAKIRLHENGEGLICKEPEVSPYRREMYDLITDCGFREGDAMQIAEMMEAAVKRPAKIRMNSMYSRMATLYGKTLADSYYKQLETLFSENLYPEGTKPKETQSMHQQAMPKPANQQKPMAQPKPVQQQRQPVHNNNNERTASNNGIKKRRLSEIPPAEI